MARHIILVPGIGDHRSYGQDKAMQLWRLFGLRPHYFPLGWKKAEGYDTKQKRLLDYIENLHTNNDTVSLVGISAGASAVLNAYAQTNKVDKVICICGKINNPQTVSNRLLKENPDFGESMKTLKKSLELLEPKTKNIMSIHPWKDQTVPVADTIIIGAKEKTTPGWSHTTGIFFGIIFGSFAISRFIRSKSQANS